MKEGKEKEKCQMDLDLQFTMLGGLPTNSNRDLKVRSQLTLRQIITGHCV